MVMPFDPDVERELGHIWERVRINEAMTQGMAELKIQVKSITEDLTELKKNRRWAIAQLIATLGVLASIATIHFSK